MRLRPTRTLAAATALLALGGVTACADGSGGRDPGRVDVVAAFYPLQFVAERVGGDAVRVTNLAKPGAEPHDLELKPRQVGEVSQAELIVYLNGFQPAVDEAVSQNGGHRTFDVAQVQPLRDLANPGPEAEPPAGDGSRGGDMGGKDPHIWLDPIRLATVADRLAQRLGALDPAHAAGYTARARALTEDLTALDAEYRQSLSTCQRREVVTGHQAFGYLADRYHLQQVGITGLTPDEEPSPRRLAQVATQAREHGATTIFFETLVSPKVADTIAREVGARTAVLDPIEGIEPGSTGDYLSVMRANLTTLKTALGCS